MSEPIPRERALEDPAFCACAGLRRATRLVTQSYDAALRPLGLKATQFTMLATLARRGILRQGELAEALVMDRTTLTRNLAPLRKRGWVHVEGGEDQRLRMVGLTEAGASMFEKALPLWRRAQLDLFERLGPEHTALLLESLEGTVEAVRAG